MTVEELIEKLLEFDLDEEVQIGYMEYMGGTDEFNIYPATAIGRSLGWVTITDKAHQLDGGEGLNND